MTKAVLWDLDGTLADSLPHHWLAWREAAEKEGLSVTHEHFIASLGLQNDEILHEWSGGRMVPADRIRVGLEKEERYRQLLRTEGIEPLPGVRDWLRRLRDAGWKLAIATSAPRLNEIAVVEALGFAEWFDARVVAEDVARSKPFPDTFLAAAERVGVPPSRAIVVEDADKGVAAGLAAGMKVIGVSARPLREATLWVPSLTELPDDAFESLLADGRG